MQVVDKSEQLSFFFFNIQFHNLAEYSNLIEVIINIYLILGIKSSMLYASKRR